MVMETESGILTPEETLRRYRLVRRLIREFDEIQTDDLRTDARVSLLVRELEVVRLHMKALFDLEEREGGLYTEITDLRPSEERTISRLRAEHVALTQSLEALRGDAKEHSLESGFANRLSRFAGDFRAHEDRENDLFLRAYHLEEGGGAGGD